MIAVIKTGGKQYKVSPGDKIRVEKLEKEEGKEVVFKDVLLVEKSNKIQIGNPLVKGASVSAKVLKNDKADKVIVFRYKPKTRHKTKKGHRQPYTEVEITKIEV
ncbi:MAG: 50S ribosomal protein L21 [Candidatus Nealsonbacteria bacterium RIFOXYB1_FULL_40_15]|uniref:Large ribosomal subunit protein bL21 n=2 Tax=Candidatus Nealsoniibacteriota TaxID=1817911 RepID=A0A1G2ES25_9BACT|nr:MAG: 50S ribosomal protein L21 [Candidatus Nealsonbacteria bacterium RIFOXYB1_FULL_40_15]OGZ28332.1 MAG: 50S ribosomal protein L21 [Candidatus Nealsonbacteria bacterium RIFOXYC1_FULL_40_7]OGZ29533.1 MAG: 50S ribosomal protein L21 [Candidatus Nealsonbacteria bacterium RIFOXYD1_FULL_39_11]